MKIIGEKQRRVKGRKWSLWIKVRRIKKMVIVGIVIKGRRMTERP
jgi:hypothetical protein